MDIGSFLLPNILDRIIHSMNITYPIKTFNKKSRTFNKIAVYSNNNPDFSRLLNRNNFMIRYLIFFALFALFPTGSISASEQEYSENLIDSLEQLISTSTDDRDKGQWYLEISKEREYLKQYAEAILQIDNAIISAEKISDYNFKAQCLVRKAYIYIGSSRDVQLRAKKIAPVIDELMLIMDIIDLPITRARIYSLQGIQAEIEHNYDDSEEMFNELIAFQKKAIKEIDQQQDTIKRLDLITDRNYKKLELASTLISWDRFDEAIEYLNQTITSEESKINPKASVFVKMLSHQLLSETYYNQKKISY